MKVFKSPCSCVRGLKLKTQDEYQQSHVNEKAAVESLLQKRAADSSISLPNSSSHSARLQEDILKVEEFAHEYGLSISNQPRERFRNPFGHSRAIRQGVQCRTVNYTHAEGSYRGRTGAIHIPPNWSASSPPFSVSTTVRKRGPTFVPTPGDNFPRATTQPAGTFTPVKLPNFTTSLGAMAPANASPSSNWAAATKPATSDLLQKHLEYGCPKSCGYLCRQRPQQPTVIPMPDAKSCWISKSPAPSPPNPLSPFIRPNTDQGFYMPSLPPFMTPATTPR